MTAQLGKPVFVFGSIFVDVRAHPQNPLNRHARNPGQTRFVHGGVGRNIAENLGLLGVQVQLVSVADQSGTAREVLERLHRSGVGTDFIVRVEQGGMGLWVAVFDTDGDVYCSVSQVPDYLPLNELVKGRGSELAAAPGLVVLEMDMNVPLVRALRDLYKAAGVPIIGLPANLDNLRADPGLLAGLHVFICNQVEAELILGRKILDLDDALAASQEMRRLGVENTVVTLGAVGAAVSGCDLPPQFIPSIVVQAVDTTGAGDSFVAGVAAGLSRGRGLLEAVRWGARVAAWTVASSDSVCLELPELVQGHPLFTEAAATEI